MRQAINRAHVPSKRRLTFKELQGAVSEKIELYLTTSRRTSIPAVVPLLHAMSPNECNGSRDCNKTLAHCTQRAGVKSEIEGALTDRRVLSAHGGPAFLFQLNEVKGVMSEVVAYVNVVQRALI
jgi:hypothetical protein